MGSCENSTGVEVLPESLHNTAAEHHQQQNLCLLKISKSGNDSDVSNGNVDPASALDGCLQLSQNDNSGCASPANFVGSVSVAGQGFGLVCENSNAISLVPEKFSDDECRTIGGDKLNEMQSGYGDCSEETNDLCVDKIVSSGENHAPDKLLEDREQSLLEGASVENGIELVGENGHIVTSLPVKLPEDDCEITGGNSSRRQTGIDDCEEETNGLCAENKGSSNSNHVLPNLVKHCDQSIELMAVSGLHEKHDEQDHQNDDGSGIVQGANEEKSDVLAAMGTGICDQVGSPLHCEVSPRNEVEQDDQQGNNNPLERVLVVTGCKSAAVAESETDSHGHKCSSVDYDSKPQLRSTADSLGDCPQQDGQTSNSPAAKEGSKDILPVTEATNCNQFSELTPLIGSPKINIQQDKEKFDWSVNVYSREVLEQNENDSLVMEKHVADNKRVPSLFDKSCMGSDSCSGFPRDCCQQNDQKTEPEILSLCITVDATSDALATLHPDVCAKKLPQETEMPIELSGTSFLVGSCDTNNYPNNSKDVNCVSMESIPTEMVEKSNLDGDIKACPSSAAHRTLDNLTMEDSFSDCDQKNGQMDDKSVDVALVKIKPEIMEEGSDVTTEIKGETCTQEIFLEGEDAYDLKGCPKIGFTSSQSCQSFGITRNSSSREVGVSHLKETVFGFISPADCSEHATSGGKELPTNDSPVKSLCQEIGLSSSRRRNQTRKSSQKTKRSSRKCKNKCKVQDLQIFKIERRKRSCLSKPARSSNWGLLGNITQFFEQSNGLGLDDIQNHEPIQTKVGRRSRKQNKSQVAGCSQKSTTKKQISSGVIRLKVKVGNEVVQNSMNNMIPDVIDASTSAGVVVSDLETKSYQGASFDVPKFANCVNVKMGKEGTQEQLECFGSKLEDARIDSDASLLEFHVASKDSEGILFSQKSSGDAEVTEKRYTDPGTSPDSEVINLVPETQGNTRCQDFPDSVLDISKAFVAPGVISVSKKGKMKQKGRATHARDCIPNTGTTSLNKVKGNKNRRGKQRKGDEVFSAKIFTSSTGANASSNSLSSKESSEEQLPLSRATELRPSEKASPEEFGTETKISSSLDVGLRLSEPQNLGDLHPSTKFNGCQLPRKSSGASKGGSKASDKARSKREDISRQRKKERKSVKKNKVKRKVECNDFINKEQADPENGNCIVDDTEKPKPHDITASMAVTNLDTASSGAVEQHLPLDNAWVRCDECYKWRRIPVALVDSIGQTNCQWICKDNTDKAFADCSIPQEKSNAEINAELGLSDADEDACEAPSKSKGLEYKRSAVSKEHEFTRISTNQFLHRSRKTQTIDEIMVCHCKSPLSGLGCGDECLNRMLNIECVRGTCPCGDLCSNQQFQKRNYANMKWERCGKKGFGLRLEENVSKGQFLIEYVGEVLDMHTYEARQKEYAYKGHKHFYFMTLNGSEVIDACAKGNLGRFINHSCDPNCRTEKWVVNGEICIGLFALRDIKKGEEVTFDYNYVRVFGAAAKKCYCSSPQCRGYIGGDPTNTEVIDQVDSDEEFLEPVMLEVGEAGDRSKNRISRTSNLNDVELQVAESELNGVNEKDNSLPAARRTVATDIEDSMNPSTSISPSHSSLELDDMKESSPSASQQADDTKSEPSPAVKQEISIEEIQRLEASAAAMLSKSSSDSMVVNKKLKSEQKRVFVKSRFLIKTSHESGHTKKVKSTSNHLNVNSKVHTMTANKSPMLSIKLKKFMDGTTNGRFETVEEKLNELLDTDGGISKRKDAAKGYLKFLLLTAASGASGNGEAIQSNRDLSMILDALLKTKSKVVLIDIINKNGLRMLHNMLKQYRSDFKKIPILRKLLKVIEYLTARDILTPEHIYGGPPCPGMESFRESMLSLTEHDDKKVHQIARSFRDRWFPRNCRKYSYIDRDDVRNEFHRGSASAKVSASQNHTCDLPGRSTEAKDGAMQSKATIASVDNAVGEGCSSPSVRDGSRTRKRKSRWDQPAEEKPSSRSHQHDEQRIQSGLLQQSGYNLSHVEEGSKDNSYCPHCFGNYCRQVEASCTSVGRKNIQMDVPPGFSSPLNPALVSTSASSTISDLTQLNDCVMVPDDVVVGHPQRKFISRLPVSYGIPLPVMQQLHLPQDGSVESWEIAPGIPFHPFPPLPPFPHRKNAASAAVNSMAIDETAEEGKQCRQDPATSCSNEKVSSTSAGNQPDISFPCDNGQQSFKRVRAASQDLGRRYFKQQKWNKVLPWIRQMNGWGALGSNLKGCIYGGEVGNAAYEPRNPYSSQDVSSRIEKAGDCVNQQNSTL